jgi:hypothetical protein
LNELEEEEDENTNYSIEEANKKPIEELPYINYGSLNMIILNDFIRRYREDNCFNYRQDIYLPKFKKK